MKGILKGIWTIVKCQVKLAWYAALIFIIDLGDPHYTFWLWIDDELNLIEKEIEEANEAVKNRPQ